MEGGAMGQHKSSVNTYVVATITVRVISKKVVTYGLILHVLLLERGG